MEKRKKDRRSFVERRMYSYTIFYPERRSGEDRRKKENRKTDQEYFYNVS